VDLVHAALEVWHASRVSSGDEPAESRIARVREKLAEPAAHLVVVERHGETVGMALAEPFRDDNGKGDVRADWGHVSMVFVRPDHQGAGVGRELLQHLISRGPWSQLSVWTRETNRRAQRLYRGCGFVATGESDSIHGGETIRRWERRDISSG